MSNGQTAAYVALLYIVTEPTVPGPPEVGYNLPIVNPVKIGMVGPKDDGGARITDYLYTIKGHENYISEGNIIWKSAHTSAQSGKDVTISVADTLTVGETYIIGVKAVNEYGEGSSVWYEFQVHHSENDPGADIPDEPSMPVVSIFVGDDYVRVEWSVGNDGGRPIQYYEVEVDYGEPIKLPATENSFVFNYTHGEKEQHNV